MATKTKKENTPGYKYLISKGTENPKLGAKLTKDGKESLFLEYYFGYSNVYDEAKGKMVVKKERRREQLKLYLIHNPRTPEERKKNAETLKVAEKIRYEKAQVMLEDSEGYRVKNDKKKVTNFLTYFKDYIKHYTKKDKRMIEMALNRFKAFLAQHPGYKKYSRVIRPEQIDKDMIIAFTEYLQAHSKGEGAKSCYQRFKKVINYAVEHEDMKKNPCIGVTIKVDDQILRKDILSTEEMQQLISYHDPKQNNDIRRAFILSLYCGLRFCDVKDLTYANVDYANHLLQFEQNKTKGHSVNSGVVIPLNKDLINLIGKPAKGQDKNSLIFKLPSYEMCSKSIKRWVESAGIEKHITWHCARHSFAVNILNNGANIKTVASLLGHSGLKHTEKYTRAVDSLKADAINSLPKLNLKK